MSESQFLDEPPHKFWRLIEMALEDLLRVEENPMMAVSMTTWYGMLPRKRICTVCFAGAFLTYHNERAYKLITQLAVDLQQEEFNTLDYHCTLESLVTGARIGEQPEIPRRQVEPWLQSALALNALRCGNLGRSIRYWGERTGEPEAPLEEMMVEARRQEHKLWPDYAINKRRFFDNVEAFVELLKRYDF